MNSPTVSMRAMSSAPAAMSPAAGRVMSHPTAIRPAMRQRTERRSLPSPAPITDPDATCVVDSANPRCELARMVAVVDASAAKPCGGDTSVMPVPSVRMMRHPPM